MIPKEEIIKYLKSKKEIGTYRSIDWKLEIIGFDELSKADKVVAVEYILKEIEKNIFEGFFIIKKEEGEE